MTSLQVARVVHEANRAYCVTLGDTSQVGWDSAPEWQQESAVKGVEGIRAGIITRPEESHESWLAEKQRAGWKYGPIKDADKKEHPCFVPYDQLPPAQRVKDAIFFAIVHACLTDVGTITPVTSADVTAATTLYFTPYGGNRIALYDGAVWTVSENRRRVDLEDERGCRVGLAGCRGDDSGRADAMTVGVSPLRQEPEA